MRCAQAAVRRLKTMARQERAGLGGARGQLGRLKLKNKLAFLRGDDDDKAKSNEEAVAATKDEAAEAELNRAVSLTSPPPGEVLPAMRLLFCQCFMGGIALGKVCFWGG